ncbi:tRNA-dihydrouridine(20a/20b) synthase [NAD(P)+]-like protein [Homalodisca vitripennis]|nr:tRNA-dihydrouridine(20a/20b) synthase [NAD(P)+]-like protein [Homalodisca vitripennis]
MGSLNLLAFTDLFSYAIPECLRSEADAPDERMPGLRSEAPAENVKTVELCRAVEACGATFVTVHGRTPLQRTEPVNIAAFKEIRDSVSLPLIANGDVKTLQDAERLQRVTGYNGPHIPLLHPQPEKTPMYLRREDQKPPWKKETAELPTHPKIRMQSSPSLMVIVNPVRDCPKGFTSRNSTEWLRIRHANIEPKLAKASALLFPTTP